ncbi:MAG TPA: folylpolyglutamate synthase/dihydrofolate synthase family protein [Candidatus Omnitrophota bacterium]|nr:folylpolyglutamate synthase/dihydrofolate synthase family protein [Candidatus Omnitrophota bacterium]
MDPREIQSYLQQFTNHEVFLHQVKPNDFRLDGLRALLRHLGNPHHHLKYVHVAGTKGKGSTCVFIAEILRQAGLRVGLFTSPHLYDVRERIRILEPGETSRGKESLFSDMICDEDLAECLGRIREVLSAHPDLDLTYFEVLTAVAFLQFIQNSIDVVVLECGLGGRFDATNVVDPLVCAITPIGWDHQNVLGHTLSAIAREKSGIIKRTCGHVVLSRQLPEAYSILEQVCWVNNSQVISVGEQLEVEDVEQTDGGTRFVICYEEKGHAFETSLLGEVQAENAAVAFGLAMVLKNFGFPIEDEHIALGFKHAFWPCRFEIVAKDPHIIVDSAHTVDSLKKSMRTLHNMFPDQPCVVVFGASKDKDIEGLCAQLDREGRVVFLTQAQHPRAHIWKEEDQRFFSKAQVNPVADLSDALRQAVDEARERGGAVLVAGSVYLASEARAIVCQKFPN